MEPAMTNQDLDSMRSAVDSVNSDIEQLVSDKLQSMDTKVCVLYLFLTCWFYCLSFFRLLNLIT